MTPLEDKSASTRVEALNSKEHIEDAGATSLDSYRLDSPPGQSTDNQAEDTKKTNSDLPNLEVVDKEDVRAQSKSSIDLDFSAFDTSGDFFSHPLLSKNDTQVTNNKKEAESKDSTEKPVKAAKVENGKVGESKENPGQVDSNTDNEPVLENTQDKPNAQVSDTTQIPVDNLQLKDELPVVEFTSKQVKGVEEGSHWQRSEDGNWSFDDGNGGTDSGVKGLDSKESKVLNVEGLEDRSVKISLDDGQVLRSRPDGSSIRFENEAAFAAGRPNRIYNPDNSTLDIEWQGDNIARLKDSRGPNYSRLNDGSYTETSSGWKGELSLNSGNGELSLKDNTKELTKSTDGSILEKMPNGSLRLTLESPQDNTKRIFNFESGSFSNEQQELSQPKSMEVVTEDGKSHLWTHQSEDNYKVDNSTKPSRITVFKNDAGEYEYSYQNLDTGYSKTVSNDSVKSIEPDLEEIRTLKDGKLAGIRYDESEYRIKYDPKGEPSKFEDLQRNTAWQKLEDGSWKAEQIDSIKPFEKPNDIDSKIVNDNDLTAEQKVRMLENTKRIEASDEFDSIEKEKFFKNVGRLLDPKSGTVFSEQERAKLAEQTLWHVASSDQNDQGSNLTCNVTTVRGVLLKEQPSIVAGIIADVANEGQFTTKDGSVIKPPVDSLRPRNNSAEQTFPPVDGSRSWLGQVWDVSAANAFYQRQTKTISGSTVPKGSISYKLVPTTGQSDHGERIVKVDSNGREWTLNKLFSNNTTKPYDGVHLFSSQMLDIHSQLGGKPKEGLVLADSNRAVGDAQDYERLGGKRAGTIQELQDFLSKADFPIIVQLNSGILRQNADMKRAIEKGEDPSKVQLAGGGEHVVLVNGYDPPASGENGTGTVCLDNSWGDINDFATASELKASGINPSDATTISVGELLNSMKRTANSKAERYSWSWVSPG